MRAAQTMPRLGVLPRRRAVSASRRCNISRKERAASGTLAPLWLGAAFLLGYLPGIYLGRGGQSPLGQQLAEYYLTAGNFTAWASVFYKLFAAAFLQLFLVVLCAFFVFGSVLLPLTFAARGMFLGLSAASVLAQGGVRGLLIYWTVSNFSSVSTLFLSLWLAADATAISSGLFQSAFKGGAARGRMERLTRRLAVCSSGAVLLAAIFSAVGSEIAVCICGRLL